MVALTPEAHSFLDMYPEFTAVCGEVTLRVPNLPQILELARIAHDGLFMTGRTTIGEWYDPATPQRNARSVVEHQFKSWTDLAGRRPRLPFAIVVGGSVIGTQGLTGDVAPYAVSREFESGSWIGPQWRGRGFGKLARWAVLAVAFDGFGAESVVSDALTINPASSRVSLACGYQADGAQTKILHGRRVELVRYRITRTRWESLTKPHIQVTGWEQLAHDLGV